MRHSRFEPSPEPSPKGEDSKKRDEGEVPRKPPICVALYPLPLGGSG